MHCRPSGTKQGSSQPTVNSREALHNDGAPPQMTRFERSVLSAAALAVVFIADHDPFQAVRLRKKKVLLGKELWSAF